MRNDGGARPTVLNKYERVIGFESNRQAKARHRRKVGATVVDKEKRNTDAAVSNLNNETPEGLQSSGARG